MHPLKIVWKYNWAGKITALIIIVLFLISIAEVLITLFSGMTVETYCNVVLGQFQTASVHNTEIVRDGVCEAVDRRALIKSWLLLGAGCSAVAASMELAPENKNRTSARITLSDIVYLDHHPLHENETHNPDLILKIKHLIYDNKNIKDLTAIVDSELSNDIEKIQTKYNLKVDRIIGKDTIKIIMDNFK